GAQLVAAGGRVDAATVGVVEILALGEGLAAALLDDVMAVGVEHGHDPDVVVVYEPVGVGVGVVAIEEPAYVAHGYFHGGYLAGVAAGVVPEGGFGAGDGVVGDVEDVGVVALIGGRDGAGPRGGLAAGVGDVHL